MMDDLFDGCLPLLVVLIFACILAAVGALIFDGTYVERRAFDKTTACQVKRMEPKRQFFTTNVVCVPINARQDTTTVQVR